MRRAWQSMMIALARSAKLKQWAQGSRATSTLAKRFVAGETSSAGVARASDLLTNCAVRSSLFYLGEYVDRLDLVEQNVAAKTEVAGMLGRAGMDVHVSVDPTQIGQSLDPALALRNAFAVAEAIAEASSGHPGVHALMLDMEDPGVTDATINLHDALAAASRPVALTLQAYLRRTEADLHAQVSRGAKVRLVKGAFSAGRNIAFANRADIKANSRRLIDLMFSPQAHDAGFYPIVATHDEQLHAYTVECARANGWRTGEYEFEMLLGVRGNIASELARRGERVRLYVPFGRDWWPYAARRIGENPWNAWLLARSLAGAT